MTLSIFTKSIYAFAAFISAFLLFWIQPLIAKHYTPLLGGSPMVWNTLLFFFQMLLLCGYAYVAFASRFFSNRLFILAHVLFAGLALFFLPIAFDTSIEVPTHGFPVFWLLKEVFLKIGIPFLFIATTAPLLQVWYVRHFHLNPKKEPFFLYAISNFGSFAALFLFLGWIEAFWRTSEQAMLWSFGVVGLLSALCLPALGVLNNATEQPKANRTLPIDTIVKLKWFALAFIPSSLLHGVTVYVTNDLLSVPIFWVVPLGLYLLTFVIAFTQFGERAQKGLLKAVLPAAFIPLLLLFWVDPLFSLTLFVLHIISFVILATTCHGELYKRRPAEEGLGSFYLWIALGGASAGFFNVMMAPLMFDTIFEYPLSIALAVALLASLKNGASQKQLIQSGTALAFVGVVWFLYINLPDVISVKYQQGFPYSKTTETMIGPLLGLIAITALITASIYTFKKNAASLAIVFIGLHLVVAETSNHSLFGFMNINSEEHQKTIFIDRNFYGVIRVVDHYKEGLRKYYNGVGGHSALQLGTTLKAGPDLGGYRSLAIGEAYNMRRPVAVLGMGPARYQCFARPDQTIEYFEINPAVVDMAKNEHLFGYLKHCGGNYKVYLGDARLEISKQPYKKYGAILSTVYWSSTVPFHLYTKEALDMYLSKLEDGGYFSIIIPNHYFDFAPLFAAYNKTSPYKFHVIQEVGNPFFRTFVLKKEAEYMPPVDWQPLVDTGVEVWTDDFYNIFDVLKDPKNMRLTRDAKRFDLL